MSEPSRREALAAFYDPDGDVVITSDDGFEKATSPHHIDAALASRDMDLVVLQGEGWRREFGHLMNPEFRQTGPEPGPSLDGGGSSLDGPPPREFEGGGLREFERVWDRTAGEFVWVEVTDREDGD